MDPRQYLSKKILLESIPVVKVSLDDLGTTDTYHEEKILQKILTYSFEDISLLVKAAIQIAVIGAGNKNYGFVRRNNGDIFQLKDIFEKMNIKYMNIQNVKLKDDDLTARRLVRFFRYQIQDFITTNKRPSYLWIKYSDKNENMIPYCFPGAEHIVETIEQCDYLMNVYLVLDKQIGSAFCVRLKRVFIARGLYKPEYLSWWRYIYKNKNKKKKMKK